MYTNENRTEETESNHIETDRPTYAGAADLAKGYLIVTEFSITGGSETQTTAAEPSATGRKVIKHVRYDHPQLQKASQSLINKAYLIVRRHCSPTFSGMYFVTEKDFAKLDEELQELRDASKVINEVAKTRGSDRRVVIEVFPMPADKNNPRIALRMGRALFDMLTRLRNTYDTDTMTAYTSEMRTLKNLDRIVMGRQNALVRDALRSAEAQRPLMIAAYGGRRGVNDALVNGRIPSFDYGPVDRAIAEFAPACEVFE